MEVLREVREEGEVGMTDREKVIRGLECCTAELGNNQHRDDFCAVCPYRDKSPDNWYCFRKQDLMRDALECIEREDMKWAAEHPVVYPTWGEWLNEQAVVIKIIDNGALIFEPDAKMRQPIPADIAQKLGIEPVPVVYGDCGATNEADARKKLGIEPKEG